VSECAEGTGAVVAQEDEVPAQVEEGTGELDGADTGTRFPMYLGEVRGKCADQNASWVVRVLTGDHGVAVV
jgi:hypothetical protein